MVWHPLSSWSWWENKINHQCLVYILAQSKSLSAVWFHAWVERTWIHILSLHTLSFYSVFQCTGYLGPRHFNVTRGFLIHLHSQGVSYVFHDFPSGTQTQVQVWKTTTTATETELVWLRWSMHDPFSPLNTREALRRANSSIGAKFDQNGGKMFFFFTKLEKWKSNSWTFPQKMNSFFSGCLPSLSLW